MKDTHKDDELQFEKTIGRSKIEFPYQDQEAAIEVAKAVFAVGGFECSWLQLAGKMNLSAEGGAFRVRVNTARIFGLLNHDRGTVTLSELGSNITDPQYEHEAKAESFLKVELFSEVYKKLVGNRLPTHTAIEQIMVSCGVTPKQKDKARQVFMRSAKQAGFFDINPERLTYPQIKGTVKDVIKKDAIKEGYLELGDNNKKQSSSESGIHPFIEGLLKALPQPEQKWPILSRIKWLQTASNIFELMYKNDGEDEDIETIEITAKKLSGKA